MMNRKSKSILGFKKQILLCILNSRVRAVPVWSDCLGMKLCLDVVGYIVIFQNQVKHSVFSDYITML